jgi:hypothetical protein
MRLKPAALALLALAAVAVHRAQAAAEGPVLGTGPFLHMIADLDKSVAFYRDTLGFKLNGPQGEHPFKSVPAVANLYGVPGRQFRATVLEIPGSEWRLNWPSGRTREARTSILASRIPALQR